MVLPPAVAPERSIRDRSGGLDPPTRRSRRAAKRDVGQDGRRSGNEQRRERGGGAQDRDAGVRGGRHRGGQAAGRARHAAAVVADPEVDVVVEVMGGIEPARSLILEAIRLGKPVVTANKELLATHGGELFDAADAAGVDLKFEAAVGGAVPIVAPLKESLAGDRVRRVLGIVNGTTNYVLWRMASTGAGYAEALAEATELGYAEPDPRADVEGFDAAAKCAILASLAFNTRVVAGDVYREGITDVTAADIAAAARMGYTVKLLA